MPEATPTWFFVLVVVRHEGRFLLVRERKHGQRWYLPAGRVEPGETLGRAALRETLEESGVPVILEGVVRVEHTLVNDEEARVRVVYLARPEGDPTPKSEPDSESLEARWISIDELDELPLRGEEVREHLTYVARGGSIASLKILAREGTPYR